MGRQTRFFMTYNDEADFLRFVSSCGDKIIDRKAQAPSETQLHSKIRQFFIISPVSRLFFSSNSGIIDSTHSDVIEFSGSVILENARVIKDGRIWVELAEYHGNQIVGAKPKWLEDKFISYKKWILQKCQISTDKKFYASKGTLGLRDREGYRLMNSPNIEIEFER